VCFFPDAHRARAAHGPAPKEALALFSTRQAVPIDPLWFRMKGVGCGNGGKRADAGNAVSAARPFRRHAVGSTGIQVGPRHSAPLPRIRREWRDKPEWIARLDLGRSTEIRELHGKHEVERFDLFGVGLARVELLKWSQQLRDRNGQA
jgi:hypothetical protein